MNKKIFSIMSVMLIILILTACGKMMPEPRLLLQYHDEQMSVIHYGNRKIKAPEDIEEWLKDYMIGKKFEELPVVSFGKEIIIGDSEFAFATLLLDSQK